MSDRELERLLALELEEARPDSVTARAVNPIRRSMRLLLLGLAMSSVTLDILCLNYILPGLGSILMLLGLRSLRQEKGFKAAFYIQLFRTGLTMAANGLRAAALWPLLAGSMAFMVWLSVISFLLTTAEMLSLRRGLKNLASGAGVKTGGFLWALVIWYIVIYGLTLLPFPASGLTTGIIALGAFSLIIWNLWLLAREITEAGFSVRPAEVKIGTFTLAALLAALSVLLVVLGYVLCPQLPMNWQVREEPGETQVREKLLSMGFPDYVLEDLTDEEVLRFQDAEQVLCYVRSYNGDGTDGNRAHAADPKPLRVTTVAVKLPVRLNTWRIVRHLEYTQPVSFYGSEAFYIRNANSYDWFFSRPGDYSGRVLCDRDGVSYAAPYALLTEENLYARSSYGHSPYYVLFGLYSLPNDARRQRCYVIVEYTAYNTLSYYLQPWMEYAHQDVPLQYPVISGKDWFQGERSFNYSFRRTQIISLLQAKGDNPKFE
ncbi:MAG: hypothetical protein II794_03845 [Oscillospiraceae bacterium]|nr:hypothetical protein [Oscillospiraceae bacterium]